MVLLFKKNGQFVTRSWQKYIVGYCLMLVCSVSLFFLFIYLFPPFFLFGLFGDFLFRDPFPNQRPVFGILVNKEVGIRRVGIAKALTETKSTQCQYPQFFKGDKEKTFTDIPIMGKRKENEAQHK